MKINQLIPMFSVLALAGVLAPAHAQTIESLAAGTLQNNGTYLWSYRVTSGSSPAISHWVLDMCPDTYASLVAGSVRGSTLYSFTNPDPTTGATGISFDDGYRDGESRVVSFNLSRDWGVENGTATFKSGLQITSVAPIAAPGCSPGQVPEPTSLALLGLLGAPAMGFLRRR